MEFGSIYLQTCITYNIVDVPILVVKIYTLSLEEHTVAVKQCNRNRRSQVLKFSPIFKVYDFNEFLCHMCHTHIMYIPTYIHDTSILAESDKYPVRHKWLW